MKTKKINLKPSRLFRNLCAVALICSVGMPLAAQAQYEEDTYYGTGASAPQIDRPIDDLFLGRVVQTQDEGTLRMSVGADHQRMDASQGNQRFTEIRAQAKYGVTDRLQLQASLPYQIDDRPGAYSAQTNIGNFQVGGMYSLMRGDDPISLSAGLDVQVPVGHQATLPSGDMRASDQTLWMPSLIVARQMGPVQAHADAQAEFGAPERGFNYDIGAIYGASRLVPSLELNARTMETAAPQFYATPGLTYRFSDRAQVGVGVPIGLNDQSRQTQIVGRISLQLP